MQTRATTLAVVVLSVLLAACGLGKQAEPQARPDTGDPLPVATTAKPAPATTTAKGRSGTLYLRTTDGTRERVTCSKIETEVKLVAEGGAAEWTSRVVDRLTPPGAGNPVSSVTVSPPSGTLPAAGASVVVKIRGSYPADKRTFWVLFEAKTTVGGAAANLDVNC